MSTRTRNFLRTLKRRPPVPTKEVETIIRDQGTPCFSSWLEFHERYAGYVETIGRDTAVWGLVHDDPAWLLARKADIDREPNENTWYATCADVHPSYNYRLDVNGEFLGPPAISFDVHLERVALGWEFSLTGASRVLSRNEVLGLEFTELFNTSIKSRHLIPEASDRDTRYYTNHQHLVVEDAERGNIRTARRLIQNA